MSNDKIIPITMPKWGLSMIEGKVIEWLVDDNVEVNVGDEIMDIETEKIANTFEALDAGVLRRKIALADQTLPIGALLGVLAPADVGDGEIDAFVEEFQSNYVPPDPEEEDAGPNYEWTDVGDYRIRYLSMGEGATTVILIHGFGGELDRWLFTQQPLSANARVVALDLPGHGQSSKSVSDGSVGALADAIAEFMDNLGIKRAVLVGHSLGGAIALQTALSHPDKVAGLSLIASAGLGDDINAGYIDGFINAESRREIKPLLQQLVGDPKLINRNLIDDVLKFKRIDGVTEALRTIAAGFISSGKQSCNLRDRLGEISAPVQVIWGSVDQIIPVEHCAALSGNVETHVLDGYGHLVQLEAASDVNQLIEKFATN